MTPQYQLKEIDPIKLLPTQNDAYNEMITKLICYNRHHGYSKIYDSPLADYDDTIRIDFVANIHRLNNMDDFGHFDYDVFYINENENITQLLFNINTFPRKGSQNEIWNNQVDFHDEIKSFKYTFDDEMLITSEMYFNFTKEDTDYLLKHYPNKLFVMKRISNMLFDIVEESYMINFNEKKNNNVTLYTFEDVEIDEKYRSLYKHFFNMDNDQKYIYKKTESNYNFFDPKTMSGLSDLVMVGIDTPHSDNHILTFDTATNNFIMTTNEPEQPKFISPNNFTKKNDLSR